MEEITANVSWVAVAVGAVASMILGFIWFNPKMPLGRAWAEGTGVGLEPPENFPALAMGMNTLGVFLVSWFVGVTAANNALLTVILATLGFSVWVGGNVLFSGNSKGAMAVTSSYWIVSVLLMIISQAIF